MGVELEAGEVVKVEVRRSKLGLIMIWAGEALGIVALTAILFLLMGAKDDLTLQLNEASMGYLYLVIIMLYIVLIVSGLVGTMVYNANHLVVTNKRVIQKTMTSLFARSLNVIALSSVEDVSFAEKNIMDRIFRVGTLRMSTVGDETTYAMSYVDASGNSAQRIMKLLSASKK